MSQRLALTKLVPNRQTGVTVAPQLVIANEEGTQ